MQPDELLPEIREAIEALPNDPRDLLTDQDRREWAEYIEQNRLRRTRIAMETGVPFNEIG